MGEAESGERLGVKSRAGSKEQSGERGGDGVGS
jgi:hypothetical protein